MYPLQIFLPSLNLSLMTCSMVTPLLLESCHCITATQQGKRTLIRMNALRFICSVQLPLPQLLLREAMPTNGDAQKSQESTPWTSQEKKNEDTNYRPRCLRIKQQDASILKTRNATVKAKGVPQVSGVRKLPRPRAATPRRVHPAELPSKLKTSAADARPLSNRTDVGPAIRGEGEAGWGGAPVLVGSGWLIFSFSPESLSCAWRTGKAASWGGYGSWPRRWRGRWGSSAPRAPTVALLAGPMSSLPRPVASERAWRRRGAWGNFSRRTTKPKRERIRTVAADWKLREQSRFLWFSAVEQCNRRVETMAMTWHDREMWSAAAFPHPRSYGEGANTWTIGRPRENRWCGPLILWRSCCSFNI
jgi:hypothetical protein